MWAIWPRKKLETVENATPLSLIFLTRAFDLVNTLDDQITQKQLKIHIFC